MWVFANTWRSAGALPAPRIQSYKHTAPPELGQVSRYIVTVSTVSVPTNSIAFITVEAYRTQRKRGVSETH